MHRDSHPIFSFVVPYIYKEILEATYWRSYAILCDILILFNLLQRRGPPAGRAPTPGGVLSGGLTEYWWIRIEFWREQFSLVANLTRLGRLSSCAVWFTGSGMNYPISSLRWVAGKPGGRKVKWNNLSAETRKHYAPKAGRLKIAPTTKSEI